ncbi:hypothetical protein NQ176_g6214 [Zarea fungicola]|uniref:Uncharacterized protein n=1 Tax=Zarea fungicola TaxID=93591 RepID=A0ACC1N5S8_9HYPO|nr:hypothetical protein NQ176_g6214 [Lecanicillium fungicola]
MSHEGLGVIALISGGKDSFYSVLHCMQNGHRIIALANLYPPSLDAPTGLLEDKKDLNSFMYQTVGHEVIPLYGDATGIPLYRQPINGSAVHHERDYAYDATEEGVDETESMLPLIQSIKEKHPEANALCSGAILSTYQRTRVESIAVRLGLTPLAYLWKYPVLPSPMIPKNEAQLLIDMEVAGLDARIIKVASAGLDESHLWERVSSEAGSNRVKHALHKFGAVDGAALGEGGEFETLVLDGPACLFKKSICVPDQSRVAVREGGGSTWLATRGAQLQEKNIFSEDLANNARVPSLLDSRFAQVLEALTERPQVVLEHTTKGSDARPLSKVGPNCVNDSELLSWSFIADTNFETEMIKEETRSILGKLREALTAHSLDEAQLSTVVIILRNMGDFTKINQEYGTLFKSPNPASRVTISCGDLLPDGRNIMIYITVPPASQTLERGGLHVQSRSYWAPANIGPYSQAIDIPILRDQRAPGPRSVYIAGQIPLIPHSMTLPASSSTSLVEQITLSLQHLWRIGTHMNVQQWTSVVAYFDKSASEADMRQKAELAGRAWNIMHAPVEEEEHVGELDPWDLKYNSQHMSLAGSADSNPKPLPDFEVFPMRQQNEPETCVPPFFAVEVTELPRQSTIEWHAHMGLSGLEEASTQLVSHAESQLGGWRSWSMIVRGDSGTFVLTALAQLEKPDTKTDVHGTMAEAQDTYADSIRRLGVDSTDGVPPRPYMMYVDMENLSGWRRKDSILKLPCAVIPSHSIWTADGKKAFCVALFRAYMSAA